MFDPLQAHPSPLEFCGATGRGESALVEPPLERRGVELGVEYLSVKTWVVFEREPVVDLL